MSESKDNILYPHNVLEGYGSGCLLDLRVRIAIQLLEHSKMFNGIMIDLGESGIAPDDVTKIIAKSALDTATELMALSESRGLVKPLPNTGELSQADRKQARVTASFNVLQQLEGNKFAQEEQGRVSVPAVVRQMPPH